MSHDPYARENPSQGSSWLIVAAVVCLLFFVLICGGVGAGVVFLARQAQDENAGSAAPRPFTARTPPAMVYPPGVAATPGSEEYARFHSLRASGQFQAALEAIDQAVQANSSNATYLNDKAWLLATCPDEEIRDGEEAVSLAERACDLTPDNEAFLDTLAAAHAEAGNFAKAVEFQMKAISINRQTAYSTGFAERLQLYKDGKPYREQIKAAGPF